MRADVVLFDLDGTLTDSAIGIKRSVSFALEAVGAPPLDDAVLRRFIGPPLQGSFRDVVGLAEAGVEAAVVAYRSYFERQGMFENAVFAGIPELLAALVEDGRRLAVATSKPQRYAVPIVEHFGLSHYFETVSGPETDGLHETKAHVVREALRRMDVEPSRGVVLVGDRIHDVEGAREAGIGCIGVLWGYGTPEELSNADVTVPNVAELGSALGVAAHEGSAVANQTSDRDLAMSDSQPM